MVKEQQDIEINKGLPFTVDFKRMLEKSLESVKASPEDGLTQLLKMVIDSDSDKIIINDTPGELSVRFDGKGISTEDELVKTILGIYAEEKNSNPDSMQGFGRALITYLAANPQSIKLETKSNGGSLCMIIDNEFRPIVYTGEKDIIENRITVIKEKPIGMRKVLQRCYANDFLDGSKAIGEYSVKILRDITNSLGYIIEYAFNFATPTELYDLVKYNPKKIYYNGRLLDTNFSDNDAIVSASYNIRDSNVLLFILNKDPFRNVRLLKNYTLLGRVEKSNLRSNCWNVLSHYDTSILPEIVANNNKLRLSVSNESIHMGNVFRDTALDIEDAILKFYTDLVAGNIKPRRKLSKSEQYKLLSFKLLLLNSNFEKQFSLIDKKTSEDSCSSIFTDVRGNRYSKAELENILQEYNYYIPITFEAKKVDLQHPALKELDLENRVVLSFENTLHYALFERMFDAAMLQGSAFQGWDAIKREKTNRRIIHGLSLESMIIAYKMEQSGIQSVRKNRRKRVIDDFMYDTLKECSVGGHLYTAGSYLCKGTLVAVAGAIGYYGASNGVPILIDATKYGLYTTGEYATGNPEIIALTIGAGLAVKYRNHIKNTASYLSGIFGNVMERHFTGTYSRICDLADSAYNPLEKNLTRASSIVTEFLRSEIENIKNKVESSRKKKKKRKEASKTLKEGLKTKVQETSLSVKTNVLKNDDYEKYVKELLRYVVIHPESYRENISKVIFLESRKPFKIDRDRADNIILLSLDSKKFENIIERYKNTEGLSLLDDLTDIAKSSDYSSPLDIWKNQGTIINEAYRRYINSVVDLLVSGDERFKSGFSSLRYPEKIYVLKEAIENDNFSSESRAGLENWLAENYKIELEEASQKLISQEEINKIIDITTDNDDLNSVNRAENYFSLLTTSQKIMLIRKIKEKNLKNYGNSMNYRIIKDSPYLKDYNQIDCILNAAFPVLRDFYRNNMDDFDRQMKLMETDGKYNPDGVFHDNPDSPLQPLQNKGIYILSQTIFNEDLTDEIQIKKADDLRKWVSNHSYWNGSEEAILSHKKRAFEVIRQWNSVRSGIIASNQIYTSHYLNDMDNINLTYFYYTLPPSDKAKFLKTFQEEHVLNSHYHGLLDMMKYTKIKPYAV